MTDTDSNRLQGTQNKAIDVNADLIATIIAQTLQINQQCIDDLSNLLATQGDAERVLSAGFLGLQSLASDLIGVIEKLTTSVEYAESHSGPKVDLAETHAKLDELCEQGKLIKDNANLVVNSQDVIRGLQFVDINGQSITFTIKTLTLYNRLLNEIVDDKGQMDLQKVWQQLSALQEHRLNEKTPVTSKNVTAGDTELF